MGGRVTTGREVIVGSVLILIRALLIAVTRGLVVIRPGLVLIARRLVVLASGLIASSGRRLCRSGRRLLRCQRPLPPGDMDAARAPLDARGGSRRYLPSDCGYLYARLSSCAQRDLASRRARDRLGGRRRCDRPQNGL